MIDLHCHVLPNVDDGSSSVSESAEMFRLYRSFGFDTVVATPHVSGDLSSGYRERIEVARDAIEDAAADAGIALEIGFEIMLDPALEMRLDQGAALSLGSSRAVLVEVPFLNWPTFTEDVIFALQLAGYRPILAHPERYEGVQARPQLAFELCKRGVVLQLTYASFAGVLGKTVQRCAERLLEVDGAVILASDAHGSGQRLRAIPDGLRRIDDLIGTERLHQLAREVPLALLRDAALPEYPARESDAIRGGKRGWFHRGR
ncbi:MAG: tyrosine-protein phosphatase [Thermomicrobiales bacterium]